MLMERIYRALATAAFILLLAVLPSDPILASALVGDVNGDGIVNCLDLAIVKAAFGSSVGQPTFDSRADVNKDGVVNILDLTIVARALPAGTVCNASTVTLPNIVGLTQAAASTAIAAAGLKLGSVTTQSSATVISGRVVSESPVAGTSVSPGSLVNLIISSGAAPAGSPIAVIDAATAVTAYSTVLLDGTSSGDSTAPLKSYVWTQTAGPAVVLSGANTAQASFTAPQVSTQTPLTFSLTVTDSLAAKATASAPISVSPATAAQLAVALVSARLLTAVPANPHTDFEPSDGPPLAGSTSTIQVAMTGAIKSLTFALVDARGNILGTPSLKTSGTAAIQPLTFFGPITVPTVPFTVTVSGTTADGQTFAVKAPTFLTPMNMSIRFSPSRLFLVAGASGHSQLTIFNGGATATFTVTYSDPYGLLSSSLPISIPIAALSSTTVPIDVAYPSTNSNVVGPTVIATASVSGYTSRVGTATLVLWQNGAQ